jgi:hypothetical protein
MDLSFGTSEIYSLRAVNEVLFSYSVMFDKEWDFAKGGKPPGTCERDMLDSSVFPQVRLSCSRRGG